MIFDLKGLNLRLNPKEGSHPCDRLTTKGRRAGPADGSKVSHMLKRNEGPASPQHVWDTLSQTGCTVTTVSFLLYPNILLGSSVEQGPKAQALEPEAKVPIMTPSLLRV